jgi:hypothetical protein
VSPTVKGENCDREADEESLEGKLVNLRNFPVSPEGQSKKDGRSRHEPRTARDSHAGSRSSVPPVAMLFLILIEPPRASKNPQLVSVGHVNLDRAPALSFLTCRARQCCSAPNHKIGCRQKDGEGSRYDELIGEHWH